MATLTSDEVEALLGRSLTSVESANFDLYLEIAEIRIEDILCTSLDDLLTTLGVDALPTDLQLVVARFFGGISTANGQEFGVESKKVEDFTITFNTETDIFGSLIKANATTLAKYSQCGSAIRHGKVLRQERYLYDGIRYIR